MQESLDPSLVRISSAGWRGVPSGGTSRSSSMWIQTVLIVVWVAYHLSS